MTDEQKQAAREEILIALRMLLCARDALHNASMYGEFSHYRNSYCSISAVRNGLYRDLARLQP